MRHCSAFFAWMLVIVVYTFGQTKEPFIYFKSTTADFGTVMQGKAIKHVFTFINKGSGNLEILQIDHS